MLGFAAIAVLETNVHGVVVQTRSEALRSARSPEVIGKRT